MNRLQKELENIAGQYAVQDPTEQEKQQAAERVHHAFISGSQDYSQAAQDVLAIQAGKMSEAALAYIVVAPSMRAAAQTEYRLRDAATKNGDVVGALEHSIKAIQLGHVANRLETTARDVRNRGERAIRAR